MTTTQAINELDAMSVRYPSRETDVDSDATETNGAQLSQDKALSFMLAGKAIFTLRSAKTGTRYTYKVSKPKPKEGYENSNVFFVSYLTGTDNNSDYTYLGMIGKEGGFRLTKASRLPATAGPVVAFQYVFNSLTARGEAPGVEIYHEGRCGRCGRRLTVPESVTSGYGPECIDMVMGGGA